MAADRILRRPIVSRTARSVPLMHQEAEMLPTSVISASALPQTPQPPFIDPAHAAAAAMAANEAEIERRAQLLAQKVLERERGAVLDAARKEGHQAGLQDGRIAARREFELARSQFEQVLSACRQRLDQEVQASENAALQITAAAMTRLLGKGPDVTQLSGMISIAASEIRNAARMTLWLAPRDIELMQSHGISQASLAPGVEITVVADPSLEMGGCRIETEHGSLDARLDVQLKALFSALLETYAKRQSAPPRGPQL